jgi:hypothetical protein
VPARMRRLLFFRMASKMSSENCGFALTLS